MTYDIFELAKYIVNYYDQKHISYLGLQNVLFLIQKQSLAIYEKKLFDDDVLKKENGIRIYKVENLFKRRDDISISNDDFKKFKDPILKPTDEKLINEVLEYFSDIPYVSLNRIINKYPEVKNAEKNEKIFKENTKYKPVLEIKKPYPIEFIANYVIKQFILQTKEIEYDEFAKAIFVIHDELGKDIKASSKVKYINGEFVMPYELSYYEEQETIKYSYQSDIFLDPKDKKIIDDILKKDINRQYTDRIDKEEVIIMNQKIITAIFLIICFIKAYSVIPSNIHVDSIDSLIASSISLIFFLALSIFVLIFNAKRGGPFKLRNLIMLSLIIIPLIIAVVLYCANYSHKAIIVSFFASVGFIVFYLFSVALDTLYSSND